MSTKGLWETVDFCAKGTCFEKEIMSSRPDLHTLHSNQHNLLMLNKTRNLYLVSLSISQREENSIYKRAMNKIEQTRTVLGTVDHPEDAIPAGQPICAGCKKLPTLPCWVCIDCSGE